MTSLHRIPICFSHKNLDIKIASPSVRGLAKDFLVEVDDVITQGSGICFSHKSLDIKTASPSVRGFEKDFVVEVDDVITRGSGISFTKAWTSGQPVQVSEVWRNILWSRLLTSSAQCECSAEILQFGALRVRGPDPFIHDTGPPFIK
jgi:hypothetical protein